MSGAAKFGDPQQWSSTKLREMSQKLAQLAKKYRFNVYKETKIPYVRAVNYKGEPVNLRLWLEKVWSGKLFAHNPSIQRFDKPPKRLRNHRMWQFVSDIYMSEMFHWIEKKDSTSTVYPDVGNLVFRDKRDFYAGSWHTFMNWWMPFVNAVSYRPFIAYYLLQN